MKFFISNMECLFRAKNRLIRVEHVGITSRLLSWNLEIGHIGMPKWVPKNENHVDFCVLPLLTNCFHKTRKEFH